MRPSPRSGARQLALACISLAVVWTGLAVACSQPASGPVPIAWGREPCAHCSMAISERRFAAEIRMGPREVLPFDDFGCAMVWLAEHGSAAEAPEIWVMDQDGGGWLDARAAFYRPDQHTPMAWGFGGVATRETGAVDFDTARRRVLDGAREREARGGS